MISAIVLAAGKSTRMGQQKMLMPWGEGSVLEKVIQTIQSAGVDEVILVTNSNIASSIQQMVSARVEINNEGEMLTSIQIGLRAQKPTAEATLICLGDQPQVQERCVRSVCETFKSNRSNLVVPSYQMRRGHPWLVAKPLWDEILHMHEPETMRDFLNAHHADIHYVEMDTPSVLQDLDTPEDYRKYKP